MSVFPSSTNTCGVFFPEGFSLFRESNSLGNLGSPARQRIGHHWESLDFFDGGNLNRRIQKRPPFGAALRHSPIEGGRFGPGKSGKLIVTVKQDESTYIHTYIHTSENADPGHAPPLGGAHTRARARPHKETYSPFGRRLRPPLTPMDHLPRDWRRRGARAPYPRIPSAR